MVLAACQESHAVLEGVANNQSVLCKQAGCGLGHGRDGKKMVFEFGSVHWYAWVPFVQLLIKTLYTSLFFGAVLYWFFGCSRRRPCRGTPNMRWPSVENSPNSFEKKLTQQDYPIKPIQNVNVPKWSKMLQLSKMIQNVPPPNPSCNQFKHSLSPRFISCKAPKFYFQDSRPNSKAGFKHHHKNDSAVNTRPPGALNKNLTSCFFFPLGIRSTLVTSTRKIAWGRWCLRWSERWPRPVKRLRRTVSLPAKWRRLGSFAGGSEISGLRLFTLGIPWEILELIYWF